MASGLLAPGSGEILVEGADLTGARTYQFARAGVAHAPEGRSVFATLSVEENLTLSFRRAFGRSGVRDALGGPSTTSPCSPSGAPRPPARCRAASSACCRWPGSGRGPQVLIADELSLGLAPIIVEQLYETLQRLRDEGTALLIVEQQVVHALELSDRVVLLDHGAVSWEGSSDEATGVVAQAFDPIS